jgi:tetratricopeptide (TPR) repeat protein
VARDLQGLSVFIASPGGLEAERGKFLDVLARRNVDEAESSGIAFLPKGHEFAYGGIGRPQELINEQIRRSDYLIVVFWDKWGSPTAEDEEYSSGTEEEFFLGLECLRSADYPMQDIVVFFKGVQDRQMSDPGEQLQRVLAFRSKLEAERLALYRTFDTIEEYSDELRRLLAKWSREWTTGQRIDGPVTSDPTDPVSPSSAVGSDPESLVAAAKQAAKQGRTTLAHQMFTQATTGAYSREAWTEYIRFLRRSGRLGLLFTAADQMISQARDAGDHRGAAEAFSNIGIAKRAQGQRQAAITYFDRALQEADAWQSQVGELDEVVSMRAFILDNKGLTWRRMAGELNNAVSAIEEAIALHGQVGDDKGKAHGLRNIGIVHAQLGRLSESIECLREAERLFGELEEDRPLAMTLSSIGETLELQGDLDGAAHSFELALGLNTDLGNSQGKSMNLAQLSRVNGRRGNATIAREYAEACVAQNQRTGNAEGLAAGLHALGRVELDDGDFSEARAYLEDSLDTFRSLDQPAGIAGAALDLAVTLNHLGELSEARALWEEALAALERSPHFGLRRQLDVVSELLRSAE